MSNDFDKWLNVIKSEMDSMYTNQVWTLVDAPESVTPWAANGSSKRRLE